MRLQIVSRCLFYGGAFGIVAGLIFQALFLRLTPDTSYFGIVLGGGSGLIVGLIDGLVALWLLPRFFPRLSDITANDYRYRSRLTGALLISTVLATFAIYTPIWYLIGGIGVGVMCSTPIAFLAAICSLIASQWLSRWYQRYLAEHVSLT